MNESAAIAEAVSPQGRKVELTERKWAYIQFEGDIDRIVTAFGQDNDPEGFPE